MSTKQNNRSILFDNILKFHADEVFAFYIDQSFCDNGIMPEPIKFAYSDKFRYKRHDYILAIALENSDMYYKKSFTYIFEIDWKNRKLIEILFKEKQKITKAYDKYLEEIYKGHRHL